eukprot:715217-Rhodomonas_salina.1
MSGTDVAYAATRRRAEASSLRQRCGPLYCSVLAYCAMVSDLGHGDMPYTVAYYDRVWGSDRGHVTMRRGVVRLEMVVPGDYVRRRTPPVVLARRRLLSHMRRAVLRYGAVVPGVCKEAGLPTREHSLVPALLPSYAPATPCPATTRGFGPSVSPYAVGLRACYAVCGTEEAYGATRRRFLIRNRDRVKQVSSRTSLRRTVLSADALASTDAVYGPTRSPSTCRL